MKFKKLFRKKSKHNRMVKFLNEIFTPIAKYVYNGKVLPSMIPSIVGNKIVYTVYIVNEESEQLAKFDVPLDNILKG